MGGPCKSNHKKKKSLDNTTKYRFCADFRERYHLEDPGVDGRIILSWIFRKWDVGHGLDRSDSGKGQMVDCCECGNERSGSIK